MNKKQARHLLYLYRPNGHDQQESHFRRAMDVVERDAELRHSFARQREVDTAFSEPLLTQKPTPQGIERARVAETLIHSHQSKTRSFLKDPAVLSVTFALVLLAGAAIWHFVIQHAQFSGHEEVARIVQAGSMAKPSQFEAVAGKAGEMADWFLINGVENFQIPPELAELPTAGVRIFDFEGQPVAVVAIDSEYDRLFLYVFPADPYGISIQPTGRWEILEGENWVTAAREEKGVCTLLSFRGRRSEMETLLAGLGVGLQGEE